MKAYTPKIISCETPEIGVAAEVSTIFGKYTFWMRMDEMISFGMNGERFGPFETMTEAEEAAQAHYDAMYAEGGAEVEIPDRPAAKKVICDHADQGKCKPCRCRFIYRGMPVKGYPSAEFCSVVNAIIKMVEVEP